MFDCHFYSLVPIHGVVPTQNPYEIPQISPSLQGTLKDLGISLDAADEVRLIEPHAFTIYNYIYIWLIIYVYVYVYIYMYYTYIHTHIFIFTITHVYTHIHV
jgi:hypothetical protein